MEMKRLTKYVWYGSDVDSDGNPIVPKASSPGNHLDGLNEGEIYIHNDPVKPAIYIRTTDGKIIPIGASNIEELAKLFLRKDKDDRSKGTISSDKGFEAGNLVKGATGAGVYKDADGNWVVETDNLKVRKKLSASEVEIQTTNHIGGQMMLTAASMIVDYVSEHDSFYRCYFLKKDSDGNVINNEWKVGDQAYCNTFNLEKQSDGTIGNHYYWRKVVGKSSGDESEESIVVGGDTINVSDYHYVDLSKDDCAADSSNPKSGDKVVHLGYQGTDDADRQNAIVIAGAGIGSPYIHLFVGINSYSLPEPEQLKPGDNRLSGVLDIKGGSTGWRNFDGLPEEIQKAVAAAEEAKSSYENLEYGKNNLLRNSGFTGDYVTASLGGSTSLEGPSQMFSPSLKYWESANATAQESELSESGKEVSILSGGSLQQTMFFKVIANEKYIFSFRGKGQSVTFSVGGYIESIPLTSEWSSYVSKFTAVNEGQIFSIRVTGDCTLCELQLERGTVRSAWGLSPLDNRSELAKYDSLTYLANLLKATTTIMGGVVNTGYINMGNLNDKGELAETTAGVSGIYNDESSVAYFAGGNLEKAIYTVATYLDNPNYTPTQEELNNMAKFVVTHGGRAILNDVILRGYIYALGGKFKGEVEALKGIFKNITTPDGSFSIDDNGTARIGGFRVKGFGLTNSNTDGTFTNDAYLKFENTSEGTLASIGSNVSLPSTGHRSVGLFENKSQELDKFSSLKNEALEVSAQGSSDNVSIKIGGGYIEGLAYKNTFVKNGINYLDKTVMNVLCINTTDATVYLPSMKVYDDGHPIRIKILGTGAVTVKMSSCETLDNFSVRNSYPVIVYGRSSLLESNTTGLNLGATGDVSEFVWVRDLKHTVNGVDYYGAWVQYRMPGA